MSDNERCYGTVPARGVGETRCGCGVPVADPRCVCGCLAYTHAFGRRGGQTVRTACSSSTCDCRLYRAEVKS